MEVLVAAGGIAQTNSWLIADEKAKQAVLFDAPNDTVGPLLDACEKKGWDLIGLWFTHGHFDHIADHAVVTGRFPRSKVMIHALDESKLAGEFRYASMFVLPFTIPPRKADMYVQDGQVLFIGSIQVKVMHVPGHAAGHVVYHLPRENALVGGDMILLGGIGRTDLPDSNYNQMKQSLQRIMALPEETTLLPGHGPTSTLMRELHSNCLVQEALQKEQT